MLSCCVPMQSRPSNYSDILQCLYHFLSYYRSWFSFSKFFIFSTSSCPFVLPCLHLPSVYFTSFPPLPFFVWLLWWSSWLTGTCVLGRVFMTMLLEKIQFNSSAEMALFNGNNETIDFAISIPDITTNTHNKTKLFLPLEKTSAVVRGVNGSVWSSPLCNCMEAWGCVKPASCLKYSCWGADI